MIQRRNLILLVAGLVLALMAILVLAAHGGDNIIDAPALLSPSTNQNFSNVSGGYLLLNATFDLAYNTTHIVNVTFRFQNRTGSFVLNTTVQNTSQNQSVFQNLTFLSTLLADGKYNITVTATNGSVLTNNSFTINSTTAVNLTIDNTPPNVTLEFLNNDVNGSNYSLTAILNNKTFNASIFDAVINGTGVANVYFWFDNGTSTDVNVSGINLSGAWYVSYNLSLLIEGKQGVRVVANDTVSNRNHTAMINFTLDFGAPNVSANTLNARNVQNGSNFSSASNNYTFNFTIFDLFTDVNNVTFYFDNATNGSSRGFNVTGFNQSGIWIVSYNVSALGQGLQGLHIRANDSVGNHNTSAVINFTVDRTIPSVSPSVSAIGTTSATLTATVNDTGAHNCSFTGSAAGSGSLISGTAISGTGAMTSFTSTLETEPSLTYSVTVTCRDHAGNSGSGTTSFTSAATASTSNGGGGSGGSSGGISAGVQGQTAKEVWSSINAGETAKVEVKNGAIGVTEVSFSVPATVYGAWVQVAKKDSLPSSVSSFSGKVYRNLEISKGPALNKEGSFADATVQFKVEKAWLAEKQLTKEAVALHRYANGAWVQLQTQVGEDDGTYVHYSAKTPGFSYFVIGEKSGAAAAPTEAAPVEAPAEEAAEEAAAAEGSAMEKKGLSKGLLLALLAAAVVVAAVVLYMRKKR